MTKFIKEADFINLAEISRRRASKQTALFDCSLFRCFVAVLTCSVVCVAQNGDHASRRHLIALVSSVLARVAVPCAIAGNIRSFSNELCIPGNKRLWPHTIPRSLSRSFRSFHFANISDFWRSRETPNSASRLSRQRSYLF